MLTKSYGVFHVKIMSSAEYHAHHAISKSGLDQIAKSPAHYWLYKNTPRDSTDAMDFGTAFHSLLLEPHLFNQNYVVVEASTKTTKIYTNAVAENPGKTVLLAKEKNLLDGMRKSFESNQTVNKVIGNSLVERSFFWKDTLTGVECRCRPDIIFADEILIDLKTTTNAREYGRDAFKYRSHVQAAFYMAGYYAATGRRVKEFLFITVEKSAPYGIVTYRAPDPFIQAGVDAMMKDLAVYARCLETDQWPCYPEEIQELSLPTWAI